MSLAVAPRNMIKYSGFCSHSSVARYFRSVFSPFRSQVVFLWFLIWICITLNLFKDLNHTNITRAAITRRIMARLWLTDLNYWPSLLKTNFFFSSSSPIRHVRICMFCIIFRMYWFLFSSSKYLSGWHLILLFLLFSPFNYHFSIQCFQFAHTLHSFCTVAGRAHAFKGEW